MVPPVVEAPEPVGLPRGVPRRRPDRGGEGTPDEERADASPEPGKGEWGCARGGSGGEGPAHREAGLKKERGRASVLQEEGSLEAQPLIIHSMRSGEVNQIAFSGVDIGDGRFANCLKKHY